MDQSAPGASHPFAVTLTGPMLTRYHGKNPSMKSEMPATAMIFSGVRKALSFSMICSISAS